MFTVTVVEALEAEATARFVASVVLQEEKLKGPVGEDESDTELPESYQPSPVGEALRVVGTVPVRVVTRLPVQDELPETVFPEALPHAVLLNDSVEGQVADHDVAVDPPGKVYPIP